MTDPTYKPEQMGGPSPEELAQLPADEVFKLPRVMMIELPPERLEELGLPGFISRQTIDLEADDKALQDLTPTVERLYDRHLERSKMWYPDLIVPWGLGRTFEGGADDYLWTPDQSPIPIEVRTAFEIGLLTEDNLPGYFNQVEQHMGHKSEAYAGWNRRWTAEEGRHSIGIRNFLNVINAVDLKQLEDDRMMQVWTMDVPDPPSVADAIAYVSLQEKATQISHRNSGRLLDATANFDQVHYPLNGDGTNVADPTEAPLVLSDADREMRTIIARQHGRAIMNEVAKDESLHFGFYNPQVAALFEIAPSHAMQAVARQVFTFDMPGKGIRDYNARARIIADAEIYDIPGHYEHLLERIVRRGWGIEDVEGLDDEGKKAQEFTVQFIDEVGRRAVTFAEKREERRAAAIARGESPVWVGQEAEAA